MDLPLDVHLDIETSGGAKPTMPRRHQLCYLEYNKGDVVNLKALRERLDGTRS